MVELDAGILRGVERGERAALESLARHFAAPVYRYLCRLCGDATVAEDLAQEVAMQLWKSLPGRRFPNSRALNAWVFTVAMNAFRMHHRRTRSAKGDVSWDGELDLPADDSFDPCLEAERGDIARQVRAAVSQLPEPERQAVLLKAFADLRYTDIAAMTGEPVGTVKWRVSQAYRRLRGLLQGSLLLPGGEDGAPVSRTGTANPPGSRRDRLRTAAAQETEGTNSPRRELDRGYDDVAMRGSSAPANPRDAWSPVDGGEPALGLATAATSAPVSALLRTGPG